ncbi:hypothetical protein TEHD10_2228 [Tetragenococcus halophilus subsp. halophilus]|uniref:hypothetical protein n=1 Tax=Tetragenococcus halophilus TaxID=51669 RepID=UPI000CACBDB1|nr:hypothetical protein [Tetragenococcus halophilus]GBD81165.1 hypothetical protein TEHD10_2228 [Tetragenococcus halophilus subsp. halophilus]
MKTVQELADELGFSRQYIQKIIQQLPATKQPKIVSGKYQLSERSEADIRTFLKDKTDKKATRNSKKSSSKLQLQSQYTKHLEEEISFLQQEVQQLQEKLEQSQRLVDQEQQLHLSDQKRIEKLEQPDEKEKNESAIQSNSATDNQQQEEQPKKGFFERLFGK